MTKSELLKWFCKNGGCNQDAGKCGLPEKCVEHCELSAMLGELVAGVPCEKDNRDGLSYDDHCDKVAEYKKEVLK